MSHKEVPEEIQKLLKQVVDHFDQEDRAVRERQIRLWKKLKYYWNGFQRLWWSEVAHDWRIFDREESTQTQDQSFYDKPVNVFRAYLESIIAALSVAVPSINCYPDDADNSLDLQTAKAGDKISELIYKHNDVILLWIHALYIYCTEGLIAAYNYPKEDAKYGTYSENQYEDVEHTESQAICPTCGAELIDNTADLERDEFMPDDDDVASHDLLLNQGKNICPQCLEAVDPEYRENKFIVQRLVGVTSKTKSRQCIEVYGGLFVKTATYAMKQSDTPYLIFSYETHYANVIEKYERLRDKLSGSNSKVGTSASGPYDTYERWGRLSTQYNGEYPTNTITVRSCWLRPAAFNVLNDEDDVNKLKKLYPDGAKIVLANDTFCEAENEALDDCWTLTHNPLSDYLQHDPLGLLLTSIQEITNDLISLVLQTIEHGIPQTFASPAVLNFEQYRKSEASPGSIFPAIPPAGKSLSEGFYEVKTATLSAEVQPFAERTQQMGQLVSGALPSLFGGAQPNSSRTAAQYAMSRSQALQRLQTPWKMLTIWWKDIFGKVIPAYIKDVADDERIVDKDENGNFINVFIRKAELQGKIGSIELEASENLPITWAQKKDIIMQLMQAANPLVMEALSSPENIPLVAQAIGLDDFSIPGEDDREKQYEEIKLLLESEPIQNINPQTQQPEEMPSVDIEPMIDNNAIHADICRHWAISSAGRLAKIENQAGYKNVLLHMERHVKIQEVMMAMTQMAATGQRSPNGNNQGTNPKQPIAAKLPQGASNATVQ